MPPGATQLRETSELTLTPEGHESIEVLLTRSWVAPGGIARPSFAGPWRRCWTTALRSGKHRLRPGATGRLRSGADRQPGAIL